jgi:hypothetical protein
VQERLKIVEAYFATKSVVLTQRQFSRDIPGRNPPIKFTIRRLLEKFRETGSVGDKNKGHSGRPRSARTANNIETETTFGGITKKINKTFVTGD